MPKGSRDFLDYTELSSYVRCKRLWYYRHWMDIVPIRTPVALLFGQHIHAALNEMYENGFSLDAALDYWNKITLPSDTVRTKLLGERILSAYHEHYKNQQIKVLHSEVSWALPYADVVFGGRMDRIVSWYDDIYVMDHKTTTQLGSTYFNQYDPHFQLAIYVRAAKEYFPNTIGAMVDAIFVGKNQRFRRDVVEFTKTSYLESLFQDAVRHARDLLWTRRLLSKTDDPSLCPRSCIPEACAAWGGCPYRELCRTDVDSRVLEVMYRKEEWACPGV